MQGNARSTCPSSKHRSAHKYHWQCLTGWRSTLRFQSSVQKQNGSFGIRRSALMCCWSLRCFAGFGGGSASMQKSWLFCLPLLNFWQRRPPRPSSDKSGDEEMMRSFARKLLDPRCPPSLAGQCCRPPAPIRPGPRGLRQTGTAMVGSGSRTESWHSCGQQFHFCCCSRHYNRLRFDVRRYNKYAKL